jgi:hypothetical protein
MEKRGTGRVTEIEDTDRTLQITKLTEKRKMEKRGTGRVTEIEDTDRTLGTLKVKEGVDILRSDLIKKSIWIEEKTETIEITEREVQIVKEIMIAIKTIEITERELQIVIEIMMAIKATGMNENIDVEVQKMMMILNMIEIGGTEMTKGVEL